MTPRVSVVVLTWNALEYTQRCLESLFERTTYPNYEVVVVDNGSTDGSLEWLRGQGRVRLVENGQNLGFTAGVNIGVEHTDPMSDVITLNNDIVITQSDWIERLRDCAYSTPDVGIVGCRLVEPDGRLNHAGSFMPPNVLQGEQIAGREFDVGQYTSRREVQCNIMAAMYIRRAVIERIGGLHPEYFSYYEDTDYCLSAKAAGFRVWYAGDVTLLHHHNTSTRVNKTDFWDVYLKSKKLFTRRWRNSLVSQYDTPVEWHSVLHRPRGYAIHSRMMMKALQDERAAVSFVNAYNQRDAPTGDPIIEDIRLRRPPDACPRVAYAQADHFHLVGGNGPHVGFTMLEVTGIPDDWAARCNLMDEVWVPSEFNVETFRHAGVSVPIRTVPLGVDPNYFHPGVRRFRSGDDFVFLSVFEWGERKNPETLLRAFTDEFKRSEDALLVLFVGNSDPSVDVEGEIGQLHLDPHGGRVVVCVNQDLPDHQMPALYASADAFVLPTRGEGWGMPILEAMAVGLPVIATDWSAQTAFFDDEVGFPIRVARTIPAVARCPFYEGWEWADPDEDHLRALMRDVYEKPQEASAKGAAAAARATEYTWAHTARRMLALLRERQ